MLPDYVHVGAASGVALRAAPRRLAFDDGALRQAPSASPALVRRMELHIPHGRLDDWLAWLRATDTGYFAVVDPHDGVTRQARIVGGQGGAPARQVSTRGRQWWVAEVELEGPAPAPALFPAAALPAYVLVAARTELARAPAERTAIEAAAIRQAETAPASPMRRRMELHIPHGRLDDWLAWLRATDTGYFAVVDPHDGVTRQARIVGGQGGAPARQVSTRGRQWWVAEVELEGPPGSTASDRIDVFDAGVSLGDRSRVYVRWSGALPGGAAPTANVWMPSAYEDSVAVPASLMADAAPSVAAVRVRAEGADQINRQVRIGSRATANEDILAAAEPGMGVLLRAPWGDLWTAPLDDVLPPDDPYRRRLRAAEWAAAWRSEIARPGPQPGFGWALIWYDPTADPPIFDPATSTTSHRGAKPW